MHGASLAALFGALCAAIPAPVSEALVVQQAGNWNETYLASLPGGQSVADTGCTRAVGGRVWLEEWADRLKEHGMQPIVRENKERFLGLGGVVVESSRAWELPADIRGAHTCVTFQEIEGDMSGLTAKGDMRRWGAVLDLAEGKLDFTALGVEGYPVPSGEGHATINFLEFGKDPLNDPKFSRLRVHESLNATATVRAQLENPESALIQQKAVAENSSEIPWSAEVRDGKKGIISRAARRLLEVSVAQLERELASTRDHGRTFVWEFFAGRAELSSQASEGGHVAFMPSGLVYRVHLRGTASQREMLRLIDKFRPWLVTFAFPRRGGSRAQHMNVAKGRAQAVAEVYQSDEEFILFTVRALILQYQNGGLGLAENPP